MTGSRDWLVECNVECCLVNACSKDGLLTIPTDTECDWLMECSVEFCGVNECSIDGLTIPSASVPGAMLRRVPEVFDCWFESGSMPYAQNHYPFEKQKEFEDGFPGDFIAEGIDQTRGWFYTLLVLSTALYGRPPFKNLICHGLVLAA